jgi:hypothetical protein
VTETEVNVKVTETKPVFSNRQLGASGPPLPMFDLSPKVNSAPELDAATKVMTLSKADSK